MYQPRRIHDISGTERDAIMADVRDLLLRYCIRPGTLRRLAELAVKEMRG
jgi:hypothetical protein